MHGDLEHKRTEKSAISNTLADHTDRLTNLVTNTNQLKSTQPNDSIKVAKEALTLAEQLDDKEVICSIYHMMAVAHHTIGNWEQSLEYNLKGFKLAEAKEFTEKAVDITLNLGIVYMSIGNYDQALDYFRKCVELSEKIGSKLNKTHCLSHIGMVYEHLGQWEQAMEYIGSINSRLPGIR